MRICILGEGWPILGGANPPAPAKEDDMSPGMNRRTFLKTTGAASAGLVLSDFKGGLSPQPALRGKKVRVGVLGTGGRGRGLLGIMLSLPGVEFPALCDINGEALAEAQEMVVKAGHPKP